MRLQALWRRSWVGGRGVVDHIAHHPKPSGWGLPATSADDRVHERSLCRDELMNREVDEPYAGRERTEAPRTVTDLS